MKFTIKKLSVKYDSYSSRRGEPYRNSNKMYIWPSKESVLENLMNRHSRPTDFYKKEVIPVIMKQIEEQFPEEAKFLGKENWGWRQKCGCSCPCSPGFVQNTHNATYSIHAEVEFISE
jgi:hypothetical protein